MFFRKHRVMCAKAGTWFLYPISDIHYDEPSSREEEFAYDEWCDWKDKITSNPYALYIGLNDWVTMFRKKTTKMLQSAMIGESEYPKLCDLYKKMLDRFMNKEMKDFSRDRFLGLTESNHGFIFQDGKTSTQYICEEMGIPYLGDESYIRLMFSENNTRKDMGGNPQINHTLMMDLVARHDAGSCTTPNTAVMKFRRDLMPLYPDARLFLIGHTHGHYVEHDTFTRFTNTLNNTPIEQRRYYVCCGSFMRSRIIDEAIIPKETNNALRNVTYAESRCLRNHGVGNPEIRITITAKRMKELGRTNPYKGHPTGQNKFIRLIDLDVVL